MSSPIDVSTALESVLVYGSVTPVLISSQHSDVVHMSPSCDQPESTLADAKSAVRRNIAATADTSQVPLVLFSGGIDSSLLALMLRDAGRDDTLLVHYSFDRADPETVAAVEIARHLGLRLEIVDPSPTLMGCLDSPGEVWPAPFADQSTVATYDLCLRLRDFANPSETVVFDGTGADGGFGLKAKTAQMQQASRLPGVVPRLGSGLYAAGAWRTTGRMEYHTRALRRLAALGPGGASIAQNSLFGIAYDADRLGEIDARLQSWLDHIASDLAVQTVLVDLVVTCAAVFAQKTYGPLHHQGFAIRYPFLSDDAVNVALATASDQQAVPAKDWLKSELRRALPATMVDRPKTGFIDPRKAMFTEPALVDAVVRSYRPGGFADGLAHPRRLDRILRDLREPARMPHGHLNLMWALAFLQRWIESRPNISAQAV